MKRKRVTPVDLPTIRRTGPAHIAPRRPVLSCPHGHGDFSADPGDYFYLPKDHVFVCENCGEPLELVTFELRRVPWKGDK